MLTLLSKLRNKAVFNRKTSFLSDILLFDWIAIPLTNLLALVSWVTPNMVTVVSGILGVAAAVFYFQSQAVIGAALMFSSLTLDCVDGNLARKTGRTSPFGAQLDRTTDSLKKALCLGALTYVSSWDYRLVILLIVAHYASFRVLQVRYSDSAQEKYTALGLEPLFEPYDILVILLFVGPLTSFEFSLIAVLVLRCIMSLHSRLSHRPKQANA